MVALWLLDLENLQRERIESLKAGLLASGVFCIADAALLSLHYWLGIADPTETIASLGVKLAIAAVSGFLFGITYRYIVRTDNNSHLQEGAVLAFGLVRGLAPVNKAPFEANYLPWLLFGVESLLCFFLARVALDWAFRNQWVKRMD